MNLLLVAPFICQARDLLSDVLYEKYEYHKGVANLFYFQTFKNKKDYYYYQLYK